MRVNLKSMDFRVTEILKPTKAKWWGDIKIGDIITFLMKITDRSGASGGKYATDVLCINYDNAKEMAYSEYQVSHYIKQFTFEAVTVKKPFQDNINTSL